MKSHSEHRRVGAMAATGAQKGRTRAHSQRGLPLAHMACRPFQFLALVQDDDGYSGNVSHSADLPHIWGALLRAAFATVAYHKVRAVIVATAALPLPRPPSDSDGKMLPESRRTFSRLGRPLWHETPGALLPKTWPPPLGDLPIDARADRLDPSVGSSAVALRRARSSPGPCSRWRAAPLQRLSAAPSRVRLRRRRPCRSRRPQGWRRRRWTS